MRSCLLPFFLVLLAVSLGCVPPSSSDRDECFVGESTCAGNVVRSCIRNDAGACKAIPCFSDSSHYEWVNVGDCGAGLCIDGRNGAFCALEPPDARCATTESFCDGSTVITCRDGYPVARSERTFLHLEWAAESTPRATSFFVGDELRLRAVRENECAERDVTGSTSFSSSTPDVVSTDASGVVHAIGPGMVMLIATEGEDEDTLPIRVERPCALPLPAEPSDLVLRPEIVQVRVGEAASLRAIATWHDLDCSSDVTTSSAWFSYAPELATVAPTGIVTGHRPGTATIDVSYAGQKAAQWVHVEE